MDNLIITGSNGFVGQSLLSYLSNQEIANQPRRIITFNRTDKSKETLAKFPNLNIEYRLNDLAKPWTFEVPNSYLINLAADGGINAYSENASKLFRTIGDNCLKWIRRNRPTKVFHASSGATFGFVPLESNEHSFKTNDFSQTKNRFIDSRISVENEFLLIANELPTEVIIGRLFSFIGPNILMKPQYAVSSFINGAIRKNKISVKGNPNTVRSYLNEIDMSNWIFRSLQRETLVKILSIGSSIEVKISDLAEFIAKETGAEVEYLNPSAPGDIYTAKNALTLESLGVEETKNWQDSVIECIEKAKGSKN